MLLSTCDLIEDCVVVSSRDLYSYFIYIYNREGNHLTSSYKSQINERITSLSVSEISEDAFTYLSIITTQSHLYVLSGTVNGSIVLDKKIDHIFKKSCHIVAEYIPLHRMIICICDTRICVLNPYNDESMKETFLKIDTKQYISLQQDQYITQCLLSSLNNGPNVFILDKSVITGCHSLKCFEMTDDGDLQVWWDADISNTHVSMARTTVYSAEDAIILAFHDEIRLYTLDGLLCNVSLRSVLDFDESNDIITSIQGINTQTAPSAVNFAPYVDKIQLFVSTFHSKLYFCSIRLPSDEVCDASVVADVDINRWDISYDSFCFHSMSFPSQIVADNQNAFESRCNSILPYFDNIFILSLPLEKLDSQVEGHLLVKNSAFGVQTIRITSADTLHAQSSSCNKFHMFGLLNAITGGGKVLSLTDNSDIYSGSYLQFMSDAKYPLSSWNGGGGGVDLNPSQYSSMMYRMEHGTPILSDYDSMYPLDISDVSNSLQVFTAVCDIPLDITPITQRSYSSVWNTLVIMSSKTLSESSIFTINHSGKFQEVMAKTDISDAEATLAFFRIRQKLVIHATKSKITLLQLKNLRKASSSTVLAACDTSLSPYVHFEKVAFSGVQWQHCGVSKPYNKKLNVFVVSSGKKFCVIQVAPDKLKIKKFKANDEDDYSDMREFFSHSMNDDIFAISLLEGSENDNGEKRLALAVSTWNSRHSVQVVSLLMTNGACCITSITNSVDMQLSPHLRDSYTGNEAISAFPFCTLHIIPTLTQEAVRCERCCVLGGCHDGDVVIFEYEYLKDSCLWREVNQWSFLVAGGIKDISMLNFYSKINYGAEQESKQRASNDKKIESTALSAIAFIVNGNQADFIIKFLTFAGDEESKVQSDVEIVRILRQSSFRSHIRPIHPYSVSKCQSTLNVKEPETNVLVDNFLWVSLTNENSLFIENESVNHAYSLCIGCKTIHHQLIPLSTVAVATVGKRLPYRVLKMIKLNNSQDSAGYKRNNNYSLLLCSHAGGGEQNNAIGVKVIDCTTLSTVWNYSAVAQFDIENEEFRQNATNRVLNISSTPFARRVPLSGESARDTPSLDSCIFSFLVFHTYSFDESSDNKHLHGVKQRVMCSLFCGKEDKRGDMLNIHLLHTALMSTVFVDNASSIPFLVCPVGNENLAVASEHGVTIIGWTYDETNSSLICSLMDLDMVALSKSASGKSIATNISVQRSFESTVNTSIKYWNKDMDRKNVAGKMMRLNPDEYSSSSQCYRIFVAIAYCGIEIFEFISGNRKLEKVSFISAEGLVIDDILHGIAASKTDVPVTAVDNVETAFTVSNDNNNDDSEDKFRHEEESKFNGSLLCTERLSRKVLLYDHRQLWMSLTESCDIRGVPIYVCPYQQYLLTNSMKLSYVARNTYTLSSICLKDDAGIIHIYSI